MTPSACGVGHHLPEAVRFFPGLWPASGESPLLGSRVSSASSPGKVDVPQSTGDSSPGDDVDDTREPRRGDSPDAGHKPGKKRTASGNGGQPRTQMVSYLSFDDDGDRDFEQEGDDAEAWPV